MLEKVAFKLTGLMNRWSNATPTACCGACKPCVTEAATNLVVVGVGVGLEAAASRRGPRLAHGPAVEDEEDRRDQDQHRLIERPGHR
jgi:hypothetical protein